MRATARSIAAALVTLSVILSPQISLADPVPPTPTPAPSPNPSPTTTATPTTSKDAKALVKELEEQAAQIEEDYEEAKLKLEESKSKVKVLQADVDAQQAKVDQLSSQARAIALMRFQSNGIDTTVQLVTASDPDTFLGQLSTSAKVDENMNNTLQQHLVEQANLADMQRVLAAEVKSLAAEEKKLAALDKEINDKLDEANQLVKTLTAQELAAMYTSDGGSTTYNITEAGEVSERIKKVISYAISHVDGSQYVRGASGPKAFDCSGFTLASYRAAGISLPHSSRSQFSVGRPVARNELKPGDLVFYYHPIHHVALYIGNGKIAHARNPRNDIVIQSLGSYPAPYAGARRVIG
ncbi:MAG: C40 family peptidase [Propionibacteriaceae bacterium]|jgi:cell wall-associated NlpC family hydrolase|nr:C40 family peptidase [Propionibacteriaceae bacterium]